MAQKRMLAKSICLSKKISRLSLKSAFIYTWLIPFLDDYGLITSEIDGIKAEIFGRRKEITRKDIQNFIQEAQNEDEDGEKLISEFKDCIKFNHFEDYQTLSPEKRAKSKFSKIPKIPQENSGENKIPQEIPVQVKRREEKLGEENLNSPQTANFKQKYLEKFKKPVEIHSSLQLLASEISDWSSGRMKIGMLMKLGKTKGEQYLRECWAEAKDAKVRDPIAYLMSVWSKTKIIKS